MTESLLTKRGVCHKLEYSPYNYTYMHFGKPVTFNFSSKLHLEKFANLRKKNFTMIYNDIYKRYKFRIDCTFLSDFNLYRKIESRGVYIKFGNEVFTSLDNIEIR